ncbi:Secondary metabolism regulator LAE1 [Colletotrichum spinosum]|uniref:Secondary metabolism regulator LAE1 n=1 Tax=Colletotrichum spinosum TaxID=1347390 RepID=A0A4R8Q4E4_9PEZI|nr:Secondary metabolism regulator LAE1 [Colletotrichum spinosum]
MSGHDNDAVIAAEEITDDDSSASRTSLASSTTSVASSILEYRQENGRTYHKYKDGKYILPNDDREKIASVRRVLDVGTGSGIWAIDFGEEHPNVEVIGIDLSAMQPAFVPPNVQFQIDGAEEPWTFSDPFDYIHSRLMTGSISNWEKCVQKCYDNLAPGGYLELNETDIAPECDDGTLKEDSAPVRSVRLWYEAMEALGTPFETFSRMKDVLIKIGFDNVHMQRFKWPTNGWPKDHRYKETGIWNYQNLAPNWEWLLMASLTRELGWTKEEVMILGMEARQDLGNRSIHAYFNMLVFSSASLPLQIGHRKY